ncbi:50S ribosomal protein L22/unknown domain fusion protein [Bacteroidales bacterium Barb4]|nr:50S ribosomal protein L22/unknown domain fusion protein [Bacteroidales bacterium Barb4]
MEKISNYKKNLFISVKPEFAKKIIRKEKRIELRKVKPHVEIGDYVIIYASSPLKSVIGFGKIQQIIEMSPEKMWKQYSSLLGIDKLRFDNYYNGKEKAVGIKIKEIQQINPIHLEALRNIVPNFQPPQVYRYVSKEMCNIIIDKDFHIYVHGNRDLIEQGIDENGRKFYKIYYQEEV